VKATDPEQREKSEQLYAALGEAGLDVLLDDRDERPGVKFKDADLIGIPFRIVPGPRALAKGCVELAERASGETREVALADVVSELRRALGR
jgi:prolyl-tRNA synthetase